MDHLHNRAMPPTSEINAMTPSATQGCPRGAELTPLPGIQPQNNNSIHGKPFHFANVCQTSACYYVGTYLLGKVLCKSMYLITCVMLRKSIKKKLLRWAILVFSANRRQIENGKDVIQYLVSHSQTRAQTPRKTKKDVIQCLEADVC